MAEPKMSNERRKDLSKLANLWQELVKSSKRCVMFECNRPAIKSHWLQQNGILSNITDANGHLIQWSPTYAFSPPGFEKKSAKKSNMMSFQGFCNECDMKLFLPIEANPPAFNDLKHQLLFSYRTMLNELRKLDFLLDLTKKAILVNSGLSLRLKRYLDSLSSARVLKLKALEYYKLIFEKDINNDVDRESSSFEIFHASLPPVGIAAALTLGSLDLNYMPKYQALKFNFSDNINADKLMMFFVTLIPTKQSSELIICWKKGPVEAIYNPLPSMDKLKSMSNQEIFKMLSDFLLGGGENWAMSDVLYSKLKASGMDEKAIQLKLFNIDRIDCGYPPDYGTFNLFERTY